MPRWSKVHRIKNERGEVIGTVIACGRSTAHSCQCGRQATHQCDYPVTRSERKGTCDRWMCRGCALRVGVNLDYCPPHARLHQGQAKGTK